MRSPIDGQDLALVAGALLFGCLMFVVVLVVAP